MVTGVEARVMPGVSTQNPSTSVIAMFRHSTQMRSQQVQHLEYEHAYDEGGNE
jgi:hypothetical protein